MPVQDLRSIARELYTVPPDRFVSERDARAKELRTAGDRSLAGRVRAIPKPSIAAWAVGLLARESQDFEKVLDLGRALRRAQDDLDPDALRALGPERRRLVTALAAEASALAERHGRRLGPSAVLEVEQTVQAALADPDATDAVLSGRLVRALSAEGADAADLTGALAGDDEIGDDGDRARDDASRDTGATPERRRREEERHERTRRERDRLEHALLEAEAQSTASRERHARLARRRTEEAEELSRLEADIAGLRDRLDRLEEERDSSTARLRSIDDQLELARGDEDHDSRDVDEIRRRIGGLH